MFVEVASRTKRSLLFLMFFSLSIIQIDLTSIVKNFANFVLICSLAVQVLIWGHYIIKQWRIQFLNGQINDDHSSKAAFGLIYTLIQFGFISIVLLTSLKAVGVNITALLAGLGVGGIAIALAAQNILGDLLASLSIVLDKPFEIGDFIIAGEEKGTVENIGIKTTRLRSINGEQIIISNKELLESRIKNYKRMTERRVILRLGVTYNTPATKMYLVPNIIKSIVNEIPHLRFDRCHFDAFGESSLDFEIVFFVESADYNLYMDQKQNLLLRILENFRKEGIDFAFPSRSLFFENSLLTTNRIHTEKLLNN